MRSIQNKFFDDIEIILVDDYSKDNSIRIIENCQNEDERIILKNKNNKGTLISRNIGALKAKGEFLIFPDSDDILSQNILSMCYETAKKNNYEMIRFNMYSEKYFPFSLIPNNLTNLILQPELRTYLIHGFGYEGLVDGIISNKFIQKKAFLIVLNDINSFYLNQKMIYFEDGLINFALHLKVKSLYLLKKIGYYYFFNADGVSRSVNRNLYLKNYFLYLKYLEENTKNIKIEKEMIFFLLNLYIYDNNLLKNITDDFQLYDDIFNKLLYNKFIIPINKNKINDLKKIIQNIRVKNKNI
jgi:glycosyltransferase involved in cell wall biosynthesis